jgi:hypothetical protein
MALNERKVKLGKVIPVLAVEALRVARGWGSHSPVAFYPHEDSWYSFLLEAESTGRMEGLGKLKNSTSSGTRTGDLPACSIVPQATTLPRAPLNVH